MLSNYMLFGIIAIAIISYYAFVLPKKDRILFGLYRYRDEVSLYAMNCPGKQETEEYQYLIGLINVEIYLIKNNISFTDFFATTVTTTVENEESVEIIINKIKEDSFMAKIYVESFEIFINYFNRKFKWFGKLCIEPSIFFLEMLTKILRVYKRKKPYEKITKAIFKTTSMSKTYEKYIKMNNTAM